MAAFGAVSSPAVIWALPAAVLTGLAFAAPVEAWAITQNKDTGFSMVFRFVMIPLFLFSATFFRSPSFPPGCARSPTPPRCGTAWRCAGGSAWGR